MDERESQTVYHRESKGGGVRGEGLCCVKRAERDSREEHSRHMSQEKQMAL